MYCKKCGATLAENDNFCVSCGTGIESKSYERNPGTIAGAIGFSACSTLCSIDDHLCFRCNCPLLK